MELRAIWWLAAFSYVACTFLGVIQFSLWDQVADLWTAQVDIFGALDHAHGLRYLLVYPVYIISDWVGIDPDLAYSVAAGMMTLGTAHLVAATIGRLRGSEHQTWGVTLVVGALFITVSLFMNGRIVPAMLGISLLLHLLVKWEIQTPRWSSAIAQILFAFLLVSVSSGTFIVALLVFYNWLVYHTISLVRQKEFHKREAMLLLTSGLFLALIAPLTLALFEKNLSFFGNGLEGAFDMLSHGIGSFISGIDVFVGILLFMVAIALITGSQFAMRSFGLVRLPIYFTLVGSVGGLFGYSTLTMSLPPLVVLGVLSANRLALRGGATLIDGQGRDAPSTT